MIKNLENVFIPRKLSSISYQEVDLDFLNNCSATINGKWYLLQNFDVTFGIWNKANQSMEINGRGTFVKRAKSLFSTFNFRANVIFESINIDFTTERDSVEFAETYLKDEVHGINLMFEDIPRVHTTITGRF